METPVLDSDIGTTYITRPATIRAAQWDGTENHADRLCQWIDSHVGRGAAIYMPARAHLYFPRPAHILIALGSDRARIQKGDWLTLGAESEGFARVKNSTFHKKYALKGTNHG